MQGDVFRKPSQSVCAVTSGGVEGLPEGTQIVFFFFFGGGGG